MTLDEFDKTSFHANMWVQYQDSKRYVISVNFEERLLALTDGKTVTPLDEWSWVRCENIKMIECEIVHLYRK